MTLKRFDPTAVLPYRPTGKGGGSKPGKLQRYWDPVYQVVGDAVVLAVKGPIESWLIDRRMRISTDELWQRLEAACPGAHAALIAWDQETGPAKTTLPNLFRSRVYKQYWVTDFDGKGNRASMSDEHWLRKFGPKHSLAKLHDRVLRGERALQDWRTFLGYSPFGSDPIKGKAGGLFDP